MRTFVIAAALAVVSLTVESAEPTAQPSATESPAASPRAAKPPPSLLDSIKKPVSWMSWGFDFRYRNEYVRNGSTFQSGLPGSDTDYMRFRPRLWTSLRPVDDVALNFRLVSEPRYFFKPEDSEGWAIEEGLFDVFNVHYTNIFQQPLSLTVGRQEFSFGDKRLIWDGSTTDGTRTEFFDAARATYNVTALQTVFDLIYIQQQSETDAWLPVINDRHRNITEQDEKAGILYVRNSSLETTHLEGYLVYRDQQRVLARGNDGYLWTTGVRVDGEVAQVWEYRAEATEQWGRVNAADRQAWGFNGLLTRKLGGKWKHKVRLGYEYLSGDDPDTATDEGWDPLWARRAQWSELMVLAFATENRGRAGDYKNLQRPSIGWSAAPSQMLGLSLDYSPLLAIENPLAGDPGFSDDGKFRGHYLQSIARLTFSKHWSGHIWGELFWPGDYYAPQHRDLAAFLRVELVFKL